MSGDHVAGYLTTRRALGYRLAEHERLLTAFVAELDAHDQTRITVDAALGWAAAPASATRRQVARRLSVVRRFADYLAAFDPATEVPPVHLCPADSGRSTPYIFTALEIRTLMGAARRLSPPLRAASLATLIGLMAATGLRTGEALRLDRDDVELRAGTLLVRESKFGKTRCLPLDATTSTALADYARRRNRLCPRPVDPGFLVSATGRRLDRRAVSTTFRTLRAQVGLAVPPGRRAPRLTDLRHSFAVTTLAGWHAAGVDVQRRLPLLSTYLGHLDPVTTYWYLDAVPQLMAIVADRVDDYRAGRS